MQGKKVPPELEEQSLRLIVRDRPDDQDALQRLFQLLQAQGKDIPPELEEQSLRLIVRDRPDDQAALQRFQLLQAQGKDIPPELEEQSLRLIVRDRPDDQDALQRLVAVLEHQGKPFPGELALRSPALIAARQARTSSQFFIHAGFARTGTKLLQRSVFPHVAGYRYLGKPFGSGAGAFSMLLGADGMEYRTRPATTCWIANSVMAPARRPSLFPMKR